MKTDFQNKESDKSSKESREVFDTLKKEWQDFLINLVYEGMNQVNSYMSAYPDSSYDSARESASKLLTNPNIDEAFKELKLELKEKAQVNADWVLNGLVELIKGAKGEDKVDVNAVRGCYNEINKMIGGHVPEKLDHTTKGDKLETTFNFLPVNSKT